MKAMKANDSGTQNLKKNIMAVAAVIERFKRVFILVAAICIVICAVSAAAEDLPGTEYPPLLSLNAQEIRFPRGNKYPVYSGPGKDYLESGGYKPYKQLKITIYFKENFCFYRKRKSKNY